MKDNSMIKARALRYSLLVAASALAGCASVPGLYTEVGAGWKFDSTTSAVLRPECHTVTLNDKQRSCGGDNPTAHWAVGFEFRRRSRCELVHFSHYFDGGADRETHMDQVRCVKRWGGRGVAH